MLTYTYVHPISFSLSSVFISVYSIRPRVLMELWLFLQFSYSPWSFSLLLQHFPYPFLWAFCPFIFSFISAASFQAASNASQQTFNRNTQARFSGADVTQWRRLVLFFPLQGLGAYSVSLLVLPNSSAQAECSSVTAAELIKRHALYILWTHTSLA